MLNTYTSYTDDDNWFLLAVVYIFHVYGYSMTLYRNLIACAGSLHDSASYNHASTCGVVVLAPKGQPIHIAWSHTGSALSVGHIVVVFFCFCFFQGTDHTKQKKNLETTQNSQGHTLQAKRTSFLNNAHSRKVGGKHCKRMASTYKRMGKLQSAITLILRCESKIRL